MSPCFFNKQIPLWGISQPSAKDIEPICCIWRFLKHSPLRSKRHAVAASGLCCWRKRFGDISNIRARLSRTRLLLLSGHTRCSLVLFATRKGQGTSAKASDSQAVEPGNTRHENGTWKPPPRLNFPHRGFLAGDSALPAGCRFLALLFSVSRLFAFLPCLSVFRSSACRFLPFLPIHRTPAIIFRIFCSDSRTTC